MELVAYKIRTGQAEVKVSTEFLVLKAYYHYCLTAAIATIQTVTATKASLLPISKIGDYTVEHIWLPQWPPVPHETDGLAKNRLGCKHSYLSDLLANSNDRKMTFACLQSLM